MKNRKKTVEKEWNVPIYEKEWNNIEFHMYYRETILYYHNNQYQEFDSKYEEKFVILLL